MRVKFWEQEYGYDRISWLWTGKSQIRKLSTVQSLTRRGSPSRMPYIYRQMIKELLLESAQLSRKFARKSAVEVERIVKILSRQAKYTYLLTPWSTVLLEKLTGSAASQEIPRIFGTRRFLTVPTRTRHLSLSWANSIQSPQLPPTSWRSILILSSHLRLGLPNGLVPSGFPTRTLCTPLPSPIRATCLDHLILLDFTERHMIKNVYWSSRKVSVILVRF